MERRLTRARNKVTDARIPFRVPPDDLLAERLAGVLRVVYLVFNEGHAATRAEPAGGGDPARAPARAADARRGRGARAARAAAADRRAVARRGWSGGELVSLADQDRSLWDARARSPRAPRCSSARCGCRGRASTRSRPRSPRCTRTRRRSRPPTGRRSPALYAELARHDRVAGRGGQPRGGDRVRRRARARAWPSRCRDDRPARPLPAAARRPRGPAAPRRRGVAERGPRTTRAIQLTDNDAEQAALGARRRGLAPAPVNSRGSFVITPVDAHAPRAGGSARRRRPSRRRARRRRSRTASTSARRDEALVRHDGVAAARRDVAGRRRRAGGGACRASAASAGARTATTACSRAATRGTDQPSRSRGSSARTVTQAAHVLRGDERALDQPVLAQRRRRRAPRSRGA